MGKKRLIEIFKENNVIMVGDFTGKSGEKYSVETDVRNAFTDFSSAITTGEAIYAYIVEQCELDAPFIGVPETGSVLAFFVNLEYYKKKKKSFSYNMIRSVPKEYQASTNSINTVLPLDNEQEYILIEDDVVTGKTLCKYLNTMVDNGMKICAVVSVFGRDSASAVCESCKQIGIPYYELINVKEIEEE